MNHARFALVPLLLLLPQQTPPAPRVSLPVEWTLVAVVPPTPALSTGIALELSRAALGRGHLDLSADPGVDHVRVHALLGAAVSSPRWQACQDLFISIDGQARRRARLRPALVRMPGGVYDAVTADLTILDVRAMARAQSVRLEVCGEQLPLPGDASARLADFVERFYRLGEFQGPAPPAPLPLVVPIEDDAPAVAVEPPTPA
ncbi:MAG: hypothetical protein GXP55_10785 [Deltaproteobacteria bacterium]|nr:hypothetical protein [Deltaproteobacteria bacterium]